MTEEKPPEKPEEEQSFFDRHGQKILGGTLGTIGFLSGGPLGAAILGGAGVWAADKMQRSKKEQT